MIGGRESLLVRGPVLIVANHPNSFLDAIIIGSLFNRPVHFLARGDAFHKPWHAKLLRILNMIPVYRLSEGKENLYLNEAAFQKSKEVLSQKGIVLIFIEGICVHKHELQPFKKGAARIALESKTKSDLQILPVGIAYDSFEHFGKAINIDFGKPIRVKSLFPFEEEARSIRHFNAVLYEEINKRISVPVSIKTDQTIKKIILFIPAVIGYLLHIPLYAPLKKFLQKKTKGTVFFDSVLFGSLLFLYPLYLIIVTTTLAFVYPHIIYIVAVLPFLAWCAVQWRRCF